jgi:hypothetical protein
MTVPPLFGWEAIVAVLVLLLAVAVAFFVLSATGHAPSGQTEFQAWLEARSSRHPASDETDAPMPGNARGEGRRAAYDPSRRGSRDGDMSVPTA